MIRRSLVLCLLGALTACDEKPTTPVPAPTATVTAVATASVHTATTALGVPVPKGAREEAKVNATFYYYKETDHAVLSRTFDAGLKTAAWAIDNEKTAGGYRMGQLSKGEAKVKFSLGCIEGGENSGECFISLQKQ